MDLLSIRTSEPGANHAHANALDGEFILAQVKLDGLEVGVFREELDKMTAPGESFDRDFVADAGHYDLALADFSGPVYGEQVTIENAGVTHAHAADPKQIVGARRKKAGAGLVVLSDMGFGQQRVAGRDPAHDRQAGLIGVIVIGEAGQVAQTNAARGAGL